MKKILLLVLVIGITRIDACQTSESAPAKLVISGSAIIQKHADLVTFSATVISQDQTAQDALNGNNEKMKLLVENLQFQGLEKGEYFTGQFSIQPIYTPQPRNPPADWKASIVGYEVHNCLNIKTTKIDLTAQLIDAAGKAGVDQISNIVFGLTDAQPYRGEVVSKATKNAIEEAQALCDAAGVKLVRVLDIVSDHGQLNVRPGINLYKMAHVEQAPYIEASDIDMRATVTITYEIAPK